MHAGFQELPCAVVRVNNLSCVARALQHLLVCPRCCPYDISSKRSCDRWAQICSSARKPIPDESDVSHPRSRKRTPSPEDERDRHHRRKRRHDDEDRDRRKERPDRGHAHTVNPQTITQKVQTILARCEGPCDIPEDDLRSIVLETVMLEQELHGMFEKRQNLAKEMEEMAAQERETIKKVHSSLPAHMQTVLKFEGDNIGINDAPVLNPAMAAMAAFPPGMFPPIPSMLKAGIPPFPPGMPMPPIGPNGMPIFPFPGVTFPENRSNSPGAEVPEIKNGQQTPPEQVQWSSGSVPKAEAQPGSPFDVAWTSSANFSGSFHEVPPVSGESRPVDFSKPPPLTNSNNGSSSNLPDMAVPPPMSSFNMPPPTFTDGENGSAPYQTSAMGRQNPSFPGQMQGSDLCKTITNLITNAIKAPSSFNSPPPSLLNTNIRVPSSGGSSSPMVPVRPNPPSLMSIPTKDPFHLGTMRIGGSGGFGKGGHRKKPHGGRGGRELRDHTASPR